MLHCWSAAVPHQRTQTRNTPNAPTPTNVPNAMIGRLEVTWQEAMQTRTFNHSLLHLHWLGLCDSVLLPSKQHHCRLVGETLVGEIPEHERQRFTSKSFVQHQISKISSMNSLFMPLINILLIHCSPVTVPIIC